MNPTPYRDIVTALESGRRALARARLSVGLLRLAGIGLATLAVLVVWAAIQRTFHLWSVPAAAAASLAGAGMLVFALVRWVVLPLVRMPDREDFVALVERRFPQEKNLIVNAFQLGDASRTSQAGRAPDLVDAVVARAAERVRGLDLRRWRDPAPDRPFLWAAGAGLGTMVLLAVLAPSLFVGSLGQVIRPSEAGAPDVVLRVTPGDIEVDRGSDLTVQIQVAGTDRAPALHFRERGGAWRALACVPGDAGGTTGSVAWTSLVSRVDRPLEYRVTALRTESPVYAITVREVPRLAGFRAHLQYPSYTGLPPETVTGGTGDIAALRGTDVDLRVLVNRSVPGGYLEWLTDRATVPTIVPLTEVDGTTWQAAFRLTESASYAVVLTEAGGAERVRSPRYRVEPVPDRAPFLTMHFPLEDHDLASDMIERVVVDAADDYGFSGVSIAYRVDDGPEITTPYSPFKRGQTEFRLDTLWDLTGLDLLPGSVLSYYVEVRDNDTVTGPKAVRSPVRQVRFPTVSEIYEDVAEDHGKEIEGLADVKDTQREIRERLEKLDEDLKRGRELNWEVRQDVEQALDQQNALEQQLSDMVRRLEETVDKASSRAQMNQELVQKMDELNTMLNSLGDEDMKRAFRELSRALERLDRNALREALEKVQVSQEDMLRGMERTLELLKQIRREEQMEDVVQRTDEIAKLQEQIAKELEKLAQKQAARAGEDVAMKGQDEAKNAEDAAKQAEEAAQQGEDEAKNAEDEGKNAEDAAKQAEDEVQDESKAGDSRKQRDAKQTPSEKTGTQNEDGAEQKPAEESAESPPASSSSQQGTEKEKSSGKPSLATLAQKQEEAEKLLEELKRLLRQLQKLNEDHAMSERLEDLEKNETMQQLSQDMKGARQGMSGGKPQDASPYAFKAQDEAKRLADMARSMQQQMASAEEALASESLEHVIEGLIDVSRVEEEVATAPEDPRSLAQKQLGLTESAGALADSLEEVMKRSFTLESPQLKKLEASINRMGRAMRHFEAGSDRAARHEARESVSDLNETIVQLMRAHEQMCGGASSGSMSQKMQQLSQGQQDVNQSTKEMLEQLARGQRLSHSDEERLAQMAAQQEMIRQGLEEARQDFAEAKDLLGDMDKLAEEMKESETRLREHRVDPRLQERQERILSRLLDAQRSIRQREMSPERQSKTGTLASRPSPPPIPENMLRRERTLAEDVLRGASDRYPTQYRKLVEEYFRALSRENRAP